MKALRCLARNIFRDLFAICWSFISQMIYIYIYIHIYTHTHIYIYTYVSIQSNQQMNRKHYSMVVYKFTSIICPNNQVKLSAKTTNHKGLISCLPRRLFWGFQDNIVIIPSTPPPPNTHTHSSSDQMPPTHRGLLFHLLHRQVSCQFF